MIPHSTGFTQTTRTHGIFDLQSANDLLRNYPRGTNLEQILKVGFPPLLHEIQCGLLAVHGALVPC